MDNVDRILSLAKDSRHKGQRSLDRFCLYESFKRDIQALELEPSCYQQAIRRLADVLGV